MRLFSIPPSRTRPWPTPSASWRWTRSRKPSPAIPGMPMGMADVATVLFTKFLKFDSADAHWPDRDRFVLSAGHGSMLLYALLYLTGYPDMTIEEIKRFRQLGSKTAGHPEYGHALGVETTTGPLGQGLATVGRHGDRRARACGALRRPRRPPHLRHRRRRLPDGRRQPRGDRPCRPSQALPLIVLWDDNQITIDGSTSLSTNLGSARALRRGRLAYDRDRRPRSGGDRGGDRRRRKRQDRPTMIACRTMIGFGAPNKQGTEATHGAPLGAAEIEARASQARLALPALRDPRRDHGRLARRRRAFARSAAGVGRPPASAPGAPSLQGGDGRRHSRRLCRPHGRPTRRISSPRSPMSPRARRRKWRSK